MNLEGNKKSLSDTAILRRIHFIFDRAARKFKSDIQLWLDWLAFCRCRKSSKQHSKVGLRVQQLALLYMSFPFPSGAEVKVAMQWVVIMGVACYLPLRW